MSDERSANAIDRRLGQCVRTRRLELGTSQERLADLLGVTFQQAQKYEGRQQDRRLAAIRDRGRAQHAGRALFRRIGRRTVQRRGGTAQGLC
jgi:transcriptional regulator with XRE-family HTH domain